jgi:hypothetical protein
MRVDAQRKYFETLVRWNNWRMPQIQGEDTTRCSQSGSKCIQLLLVIDVERTCQSNDQPKGMDFMFSLWNGKPKDLQLKSIAIRLLTQTSS